MPTNDLVPTAVEGVLVPDPAAELAAMQKVNQVLGPLDAAARQRVIAWASDLFGISVNRRDVHRFPGDSSITAPNREEVSPSEFSDVATLFVAANPTTGAEKALVVGYWLQVSQGREDWDGFSVNTELKHLGHGLKNVTDALDSLIEQRPQLVIQTKKSGKSKQARKQYRLTVEGVKRVSQMLSGASDVRSNE